MFIFVSVKTLGLFEGEKKKEKTKKKKHLRKADLYDILIRLNT